MSAIEVNKILSAIIVGIIVIVIISFLGDFITNEPDNEVAENAYYIDLSEIQNNSNTQNTSLSKVEEVSILLASSSVEKGEKIFKKCGACHTYNKDGVSKIGPNLWNVLNRKKGGVEGFAYSKELISYGGIWGYEELNQFLYKPKEYIKGTKMNYSGLKNVQDRADLILFLRNQSDILESLPE